MHRTQLHPGQEQRREHDDEERPEVVDQVGLDRRARCAGRRRAGSGSRTGRRRRAPGSTCGTRHCRASGHAGTRCRSPGRSPVRESGGTCAKATPSEARVAQSAIAPSASSGRAHRRAAAAQRQNRHSQPDCRDDRRRRGPGCGPRSTQVDQSIGLPCRRRCRASSSMPATHSRRRGRSAWIASSRRFTTSAGGLLGVRLEHRRELLDRGVGLAQARDRSVAPHCAQLMRLARRQRRAAGCALHRLLLRAA